MKRLLRKFMLTFIQPEFISQHSITEVPYDDRKNQHEDNCIAVGKECRDFIRDHGDEVSPSTVSKFIRYAYLFYYY